LHDHDNDLAFILKALNVLHRKFYEQVDDDVEHPDVCRILPLIKMQALLDVHIVFSGVIPLGQDPHVNELWIMAHQFGAKCYTDVNPNMTHLVAKKVLFDNIGRNSKSQGCTRNGVCVDCQGRMAD
jgi:RNA polymerase II subunit A-like phosphatase